LAQNLFDPKAAVESRKVMMQAQLEAVKALKKAPKSKSADKKPPPPKKGKAEPEPE